MEAPAAAPRKLRGSDQKTRPSLNVDVMFLGLVFRIGKIRQDAEGVVGESVAGQRAAVGSVYLPLPAENRCRKVMSPV